MSYTFNGTSQYLREQRTTNALASAWPVTIFCRAKSSDTTNFQIAATYIYSNNPWNGLQLTMAGATVGDPVNFGRFGVAGISSSVSYSGGGWVAFAGRGSSDTVFDIDAENTVTTGPTTSTTWTNASDMQIGARLTPSFDSGLTGSVACVAFWNALLDDAEIASLVAGFSPRRIRPQSLRWYAPLVRELVVPQRATNPTSALAATASPSVSDHPRCYGF
jgi:hypothetical protein